MIKGSQGYQPNSRIKGSGSNPIHNPSKRARISGLKARNNGHKFEHIIDIVCKMYKKNGVAYIQKTPEPMRVIKNKGEGRFTCVFEKKAQPDYTGVMQGGQSIMFEAKHSDGTHFRFDRINDEQWDALQTHHALGGLTYVLLRFNRTDYYSVPFDEWIKLTKTIKKKSVNEIDLQPYRVNYVNGFVDFLNML